MPEQHPSRTIGRRGFLAAAPVGDLGTGRVTPVAV